MLYLLLWWIFGIAGFIFWWTTNHMFYVEDMLFALLVGILIGPFAFFIGWVNTSLRKNNMVTLPKHFVATKYPGYFWNIEDEKLYSVKITGTLKALVQNKGWDYALKQYCPIGYNVSVNGRKRFLSKDELIKLKPSKQTFPIYSEQMKLW